ncbi:hypothetical protein PSECIP111951_00310 [Pseudoalteromonas holothuriae]|uniref:Flagella basal body P-ring formation protein FlgA SAF domain-containing protein n=1 Tax=Pseudoalteromonas holothuriae TaxID=2963714 RepID=A0ABM9GDX3_9GAMM|nr:hypothetical protein PSECIP111951_00310 [Pseudoalteromonas sp. CIP111951]
MRFSAVFVFYLLIGLCVISPTVKSAEPTLVVRINKMQHQGNGTILIESIADVSGSNSHLVNQVKALEIAWPKLANRLTSKDITKSVKAIAPNLSVDWKVTGLRQVFLKQCWQLPKVEIEQVAARQVELWLESSHIRLVSAKFHDDLERLCVPHKTSKVSVKSYAPNTVFSKQRLTLDLDNGYEFSIVMLLEFERLSPVLVVDKKKNTLLSAADIQWQWHRINHLKLPNHKMVVKDLIVSRNLKFGSVLNNNNTRIKPLVKQGDQVQFKMQDGALFITGKAKALGEGQLKDEINIMLESSNQAIKAKIVQKGVVVVLQ